MTNEEINKALPISTIVPQITLEDYLLILCRYGKPILFCMGKDRWHCSIEMFVNLKGVEFKVTSTFDEPTPLRAVMTCYERIQNALKENK